MLSLKTICFGLTFVFAVAAAIATHISWVSPKCRANYLPAKMICSGGFVLTGVLATAATGFAQYGLLITVGLIFGALGDFFLEWKQAKYFYPGVLCFAIGHSFYIFSLLTADAAIKPKLKYYLIAVPIIIALDMVFMQYEKIKFKGIEMLNMPYALLLFFMLATTILRCFTDVQAGTHIARGVMVAIAGLLFVISDSFLGSQLFGKSHFKHPEAVVLYAYFPAQILYAVSILFA